MDIPYSLLRAAAIQILFDNFRSNARVWDIGDKCWDRLQSFKWLQIVEFHIIMSMNQKKSAVL